MNSRRRVTDTAGEEKMDADNEMLVRGKLVVSHLVILILFIWTTVTSGHVKLQIKI